MKNIENRSRNHKNKKTDLKFKYYTSKNPKIGKTDIKFENYTSTNTRSEHYQFAPLYIFYLPIDPIVLIFPFINFLSPTSPIVSKKYFFPYSSPRVIVQNTPTPGVSLVLPEVFIVSKNAFPAPTWRHSNPGKILFTIGNPRGPPTRSLTKLINFSIKNHHFNLHFQQKWNLHIL